MEINAGIFELVGSKKEIRKGKSLREIT